MNFANRYASLVVLLLTTIGLVTAAFAEAPALEDGQSPPQDFSADPVAFDSVAITKSPVVLKGIYGSRSPGSRSAALVPVFSTEVAVLRSLRWLQSIQNEDGSWGGDSDAVDAGTAMALLTFMGHGETPASDKFGDTVRRGFEFLAADMKQPDRFERKGQPAAYGHGISTWAVCEGFGLTKVPMLRYAGEEGLAIILKGQRESGLWDPLYRTEEGDDDVEASVWQVVAVKSGLMSGLETDEIRDCLRRAAEGMEKALEAGADIPTAAAAAYCLQLAGRGNTAACKAGVEKVTAVTPDWNAPDCPDPVFRWYLVARVRFHHGSRAWSSWNRMFTPMLVRKQIVTDKAGTKGFWQSPGDGERFGRI